MDAFVPAFAPFQGRARLAHAPRKRHVHSQSALVGLEVPLYFSLRKRVGPTHISLIRTDRVCSHKQLVLRPICLQHLRLRILSFSAFGFPRIHRPLQRSLRSLIVERTLLVDITAAKPGSDDAQLTGLAPSITHSTRQLNTMEQRHSSPSSRGRSPRPTTGRQRSNSVPFVEALGCSTPEARLMMAEGKAAVRNRRRGRQNRPLNEEQNATTFDPRNHLKYLDSSYQESESEVRAVKIHHSRHPSDSTDKSTSTIVAPNRDGQPTADGSPSPLGNYSANLASFIKAQLRTIPTYTTSPDQISPKSCPDLSFQMRTPPQSPNKIARKPSDAPRIISIPPVRPPLQSAFSAWSSTDDSEDDEVPGLPEIDRYTHAGITKATSNGSTPSVLGYYAGPNDSFLFSSTPSEEPHTTKGFQFPNPPALLHSPSEPHSPPHDDDADYYSSSYSSRPQLTSSSAPSISSSAASASSYFEYKRPLSSLFPPDMKDRVVAAVTPARGKIMTAISPFEGAALSNVHDVFIESQHRVHVDGMSFDMLRDFVMPASRVSTPV